MRAGASAVARPIMRDSLVIMISQICSKGTVYLVAVMVARYLTVQDFAIFNFFLVTTTLLTGYLGLGLPLAVTKLLAQRVRSEATDDAVHAILWLGGLSSLFVLVAGPFLMPLLLPDELPLRGLWVVVGAIAGIWVGLAQTGLYAVGRFAETLVPTLVGSAVFAVGAVWAAVTGSLFVLLCGIVSAPILMTVLLTVRLARADVMMKRLRLYKPSMRTIGTVLRVALPGMGLNVVFVTLNWVVARSLLEHQQTMREFNILSLGMQWFALALFVPMSAGQAMFPRYVRMAADRELGARAIALPSLATAALMLIASPVGFAATPVINWIYGSTYRIEPGFVGTVLLLAAVAGAQTLLACVVIAFRGAPTWLWVNIAGLAACVLVIVVWPPTTALEALARTAVFHVVALVGAACLAWHLVRRPSAVAPSTQASGTGV